jgi:hypothetical protein
VGETNREYQARVRAYTRAVSGQSDRDETDVYKAGGMKVGMPWGCWFFIILAVIGLVAGFKACFL